MRWEALNVSESDTGLEPDDEPKAVGSEEDSEREWA